MINERDHLVLGCATLAQGCEYVERLTGAQAVEGGRHPGMGTHNALVKLGARLYLEVIAIDPEAPQPPRPRWFDLDAPALQQALADKPQLLSWVAHTDDIDDALMRTTMALGPVQTMRRGDWSWRITIPENGARAGGGVLPTLIQWSTDAHPCDRLPESGVSLSQIAAAHPEPDTMRDALKALKLADALQVTYAAVPRLAAMLRTPRGLVSI
ncbi:MAG: VOC family protein [Casimicrobiaceae bacterium]